MTAIRRAVLAVAALILGLVAYGSISANARGPITISFWHAMRGDKEAALRGLVADFERENPDVKVEPRFVGSNNPQWGNDYDSLYRGMLESLAAHTPPDVAQVYENWTAQFMDYGYLVPVQDYFASSDTFSQSDVADLVPVFRDANTYNNKLWTLPFNKSIYVLYYNDNLLRLKGVAPPRTWSELRATAQKLTAPDRSVYGVSVQPNVDTFANFLYAHGGDFINGNQAVFNSMAGVSALQFWVDLANNDRTAFPTFDPATPFEQGRAAMYVYTTSYYQHAVHATQFKLRIAAMPGEPDATHHVQLAGTNLALFKTSAEHQAAAWRFIRFLTSRSVTIRWALRTGYLPVRQSSIQSAEYQAWLAKNPDYRDAAVANLKFGCVQPRVPAWESIRGIINDAMYEAISRRATPQDALDRAVAMSNDLIKKILGGLQR